MPSGWSGAPQGRRQSAATAMTAEPAEPAKTANTANTANTAKIQGDSMRHLCWCLKAGA
jgi:hypothetical protein